MNTSSSVADTTIQYQVSAARMEIDRFVVPTVTIFIGLILCFFMLFPLSAILKMSFFKEGEFALANFTLANFQKYFTTAYTLRALWHSLYVSVATTIIVTIIIFFYAYAMTRTTIRGKTFFRNKNRLEYLRGHRDYCLRSSLLPAPRLCHLIHHPFGGGYPAG
jgi:hypothetical protein